MAISGSGNEGTTTTLDPALAAILSQASAGLTGGFQSQYAAGQQQLAGNQAQYGPGGVLQGQLETQYQQSAAQNQLSLQGIQAQQQYAGISNPIEQQQYKLGQEQNANTYQQNILGNNQAISASGAANTTGQKEAASQNALIYGPNGFNAVNAQLGQQQTLAGQNLQNTQLQEAAKANGLSGQELLTGLQQGIQNLGMTGATNANQILSSLGQDYSQLGAGEAALYSQIGTAGGIPQIFNTQSKPSTPAPPSTRTGTGQQQRTG